MPEVSIQAQLGDIRRQLTDLREQLAELKRSQAANFAHAFALLDRLASKTDVAHAGYERRTTQQETR
jgi:hypothetical protein